MVFRASEQFDYRLVTIARPAARPRLLCKFSAKPQRYRCSAERGAIGSAAMSYWGKILGGAAGFAIGGPIGALLGAAAGHAIDSIDQLSHAQQAVPATADTPLTE